jgi:hypothetical protein
LPSLNQAWPGCTQLHNVLFAHNSKRLAQAAVDWAAYKVLYYHLKRTSENRIAYTNMIGTQHTCMHARAL